MSKERPKGVIGEWYTLTTNFNGAIRTEDRKAGYTWQCEEIDVLGEPKIDGVGISASEGYRLATPEEIARAGGLTPYQQAVSEHMAGAPEELRDYVCGRLRESDWWEEKLSPIINCGFYWKISEEGQMFWAFIDDNRWEDAMATEFWKSRQQQPTEQVTEQPKPSKEAREFWERVFIQQKIDENNCTTEDMAELADEALAEWQKRFEP